MLNKGYEKIDVIGFVPYFETRNKQKVKISR